MSAWLFLLGNIVFGCLVAKVHKKRFIRTVFPVFILGLGRSGVSALGVWGMTFVFFAQGCRSFCARPSAFLRKTVSVFAQRCRRLCAKASGVVLNVCCCLVPAPVGWSFLMGCLCCFIHSLCFA